MTVNQLNTSAILGNVSFTTGEQVTPGQGAIFLLGKVIGFGAGDLYLYHDISQFCVFATDYFNTGGSVSATLNSMIFKNKNALDNPTDSGLYVNDSAVLTNATLPNTEFSTLNTTDKTIIGAINELKARLDNLGI